MFSFYMIVGNFVLLNLFISVINEGLAYMHENPEEADFDEELAGYLKVWYIQSLLKIENV